MAPTPESIGKGETEFAQQTALFCWCALNQNIYPELEWFYAVKNEEKSGSIVRGARARVSGVKSGVSDTFLPVKRGGYSGLYIEMKRPNMKPKRPDSKGGVSQEQLDFGRFVLSQGFGFVVCYSWEEARDILVQYLNS